MLAAVAGASEVPANLGVVGSICAPPSAENDLRIRAALGRDVDWFDLIETGAENGILPFLCARLLAGFFDDLPPNLQAAMQTHLEQHRSHVRKINGALVDILTGFDKAGIPAIPFKGPTLSKRAFADTEIRVFSDLDILIPADHVDRAVACLLDAGYRHQAHLNPRQLVAVRGYGGQYFMSHPKTGVCVEPHWAFTPTTLAVDLDYDYLWLQAEKRVFQGQNILALRPEHETLILCIHATKEYWRSLKPVTDLAWFIKGHPQLDWSGLIESARRWGCLRMLLLGLQLTHKLLYSEIPFSVRQLILQDKVVCNLSRQLIEAMEQGRPPPVNPYHIDRYRLIVRERWRDKLYFMLRTICTPRTQHYELIRLPKALRGLYVPIKLAWDYLLMPGRSALNRCLCGSGSKKGSS